jgi:tetratricopeptide (TPR) repeat protein
MKLKTISWTCWMLAIFFLGLLPVGLNARQQPKEQPAPPDLIPPVLAPESEGEKPAPSKPQPTLTTEDRADIYMARKAYADAIDYYKRALEEVKRTRASLWNKLGIAYQQQMNYSEARKAYKQAIRRDKMFAEAWNNMGTTYFLQNRPKKSLKYYRQAIKLNPDSASFHLNLGTSLYRLKKIEPALEEYRAALNIDPSVLTERSALGTVVQTRSPDAKFFFYLAKVFASLGRAEEAVRYLRRAFEDGFDDTKALDRDPDFKKISEFPAYVELRANPPKAIRD